MSLGWSELVPPLGVDRFSLGCGNTLKQLCFCNGKIIMSRKWTIPGNVPGFAPSKPFVNTALIDIFFQVVKH